MCYTLLQGGPGSLGPWPIGDSWPSSSLSHSGFECGPTGGGFLSKRSHLHY